MSITLHVQCLPRVATPQKREETAREVQSTPKLTFCCLNIEVEHEGSRFRSDLRASFEQQAHVNKVTAHAHNRHKISHSEHNQNS